MTGNVQLYLPERSLGSGSDGRAVSRIRGAGQGAYLAGKLVLLPTARKGTKRPDYSDIEKACRGLYWIATEFRRRKIEGGGAIANIPIGEDLENAPCGGDSFAAIHQGRNLQIDWHIKGGGNTRDPTRCLRIYYTFDPITQEAIVADMPAHRRTDAT